MERFDRVELEKLQLLQNAWREGIDSGDSGEIDFSELKQEARRRLGKPHSSPAGLTRGSKRVATMIGMRVFVIGRWDDLRSKTITLQDFKQGDESFIPIFSDENHFREETKGSGFEHQGIGMDRDFFLSLLRGDELLILNPGSSNPMRLRKSDIA